MIMGILFFILILAILILIHEIGHFITARWFKVRVEEFGFGFPPRLFSIKKKETNYSLNLLPLGGFVKLYGEDGQNREDKNSFGAKKIWQRAVILIAGVFNNFLIAFVALILLFGLGMPSLITSQNEKYVKEKEIKIVEVIKNSPAALSGLKIGDRILSLTYSDQNFQREFFYPINNIDEFQNLAKKYVGQEVSLLVERNRDKLVFNLAPRPSLKENEGLVGVGLLESGIIITPWSQSVSKAFREVFINAGQIISALYQNVKALFIKTEAPEISGPVGIAVISTKIYHLGWRYLASFFAILSLNLAVLNFLPFPALDGGRLLFLLIEKIRKKPVSQKVEGLVNTVGFALIMLLILVVTIKDIKALI